MPGFNHLVLRGVLTDKDSIVTATRQVNSLFRTDAHSVGGEEGDDDDKSLSDLRDCNQRLATVVRTICSDLGGQKLTYDQLIITFWVLVSSLDGKIYEPHVYQRYKDSILKVMGVRKPPKVVLTRASRRMGKTYVISINTAVLALMGGHFRTVVISPFQAQSRELADRVKHFLRILKARFVVDNSEEFSFVRHEFRDLVKDPSNHEDERVISKISCMNAHTHDSKMYVLISIFIVRVCGSRWRVGVGVGMHVFVQRLG
jgi:hypothetical protein